MDKSKCIEDLVRRLVGEVVTISPIGDQFIQTKAGTGTNLCIGGMVVLSKQGFDLWADNYDKTVQVSEENNQYPFAGYKAVLNTIYNEVMQKETSQVLDIGFGTGVLASKLYEKGHQVIGVDFSNKMIEIAQPKMPNAHLLEWDISNGLPDFVKARTYDTIISTYTLHHLEDKEKIAFIKALFQQLTDNGKIIIGDISFKTREGLEECKRESIRYWDDDEFYFVFEEIKPHLQEFCHCEYYPISHCAAVLVIQKQ